MTSREFHTCGHCVCPYSTEADNFDPLLIFQTLAEQFEVLLYCCKFEDRKPFDKERGKLVSRAIDTFVRATKDKLLKIRMTRL